MAERLTQRDKERGFAWSGYSSTDIVNKLAHYEDLEEQGRLHIVPKPFWDKIMEHLIKMECPFEHDLKGFNEDDCKVDDGRCRLCWEMALKVGGEK